jgi:DNA-binding MarR family transcriptional regulator
MNDENHNMQELATLVAGMSRFLARFANITPFQETGLGLAEWSALSIIVDNAGINSRQLANILGVSPQRINQVTDSLNSEACISLKSSVEDARQKIINITPLGKARLHELNAKLQPLVTAAVIDRPQAITRTRAIVNKILMRIAIPPKPIKQESVKPEAHRTR